MVVMAMSSSEQKDLILARLREAQATIFHVIQVVEMGSGDGSP